ncbi:MAG: D-alanyl-D-alanine carboxypeptidase, partial [Betaproteobacteria bacterium]|nr:D-alanyl-D-alanine carboxypeptidase [Betaproteobacteria bacterium]
AEKRKGTVESRQPLVAPIRAGQQVGTMKVTLDGRAFRELPVVALEGVPLAGFFGRAWDSMRLLLK